MVDKHMRVRNESLLNLTLALRRPATAGPAIAALRGNPDPTAVEGLFELVAAAPTARLTLAALDTLGELSHPLVEQAVRLALRGSYPQVRLLAVQMAHRRRWPGFDAEFVRVLREDESSPNRRAALDALAEGPQRWEILHAADDPHWRVRQALIRHLLTWPSSEREPILARLTGPSVRARGVMAYLRWAWEGVEPADWAALTPDDPVARCPFWDWDPAVLAARLARMGLAERAAAREVMPFLATQEDERVWKPAVDTLREYGEPRHFAAVLASLDDPRHGTGPAVARLFSGLDGDRIEEIARYLVEEITPSPAQRRWVAQQIGTTIPRDPSEAWQVKVTPTAVTIDPDPPGRGGGIINPFVRAEALTEEMASRLVADPHLESSWHVLERACRLLRRPLWELEPEAPWTPPGEPEVPRSILEPIPALPPHRVRLAETSLVVSRVGISGHYLLPVEGFHRAAEAGVNWFFWEPNYSTLTEFMTRLGPTARRRLHAVAGTFEAEPAKMRKDVERALRMLRVERLALFLVFWVQSWDRLTPGVREELQRLKDEGKVLATGLSTHNRPLAVHAIDEGWNPVMVRHSAAHRGAEEVIFPRAQERGTTLLTFNNLCYGRMLQPLGGLPPADPADCYRYTLSFPAVSACWAAPANLEQLRASLAALANPTLSPERKAELQRRGAALYREETIFRRLVRQL